MARASTDLDKKRTELSQFAGGLGLGSCTLVYREWVISPWLWNAGLLVGEAMFGHKAPWLPPRHGPLATMAALE